MTFEVPISQAYQLIVGRVVYLEDREELMDQWREDAEEGLQRMHDEISRLEHRMDDLWDAVLAALENFDRDMPVTKTRVAYTAPAEPVCADCYMTNGDHTPYCGTPIG